MAVERQSVMIVDTSRVIDIVFGDYRACDTRYILGKEKPQVVVPRGVVRELDALSGTSLDHLDAVFPFFPGGLDDILGVQPKITNVVPSDRWRNGRLSAVDKSLVDLAEQLQGDHEIIYVATSDVALGQVASTVLNTSVLGLDQQHAHKVLSNAMLIYLDVISDLYYYPAADGDIAHLLVARDIDLAENGQHQVVFGVSSRRLEPTPELFSIPIVIHESAVRYVPDEYLSRRNVVARYIQNLPGRILLHQQRSSTRAHCANGQSYGRYRNDMLVRRIPTCAICGDDLSRISDDSYERIKTLREQYRDHKLHFFHQNRYQDYEILDLSE